MKATEQYVPVVLFIILYKVVLTFESEDEILWCDHSNESYWAVLSCDHQITHLWHYFSMIPVVIQSFTKRNFNISRFWLAARLVLAWNRQQFLTPPVVSPRKDVWGTSAEIQYWWCVASQIWVVRLIGRTTREIGFKQTVTSMEFLPSFNGHH